MMMSDEDLKQTEEQDGGAQDDIEALVSALESGAEFSGEGSPAPENAQPEIPFDAAIAMILGAGFDILAPNWKVTPQEVKLLADAYAPLAEKYLPDSSNFGVEVSAVLVTAMVLGPRLRTPRTLVAANDESVEDEKAA